MPCRECNATHTNIMSSTLCTDCGKKLQKYNEEVKAARLAVEAFNEAAFVHGGIADSLSVYGIH